MDSVKIKVLETYDPKFCCVCAQNSETFYLNIFENVIVFRNIYISLAQIINETLNFNVSQLICSLKIREFPNVYLYFNHRFNKMPIDSKKFASIAKAKLWISLFLKGELKKLEKSLKNQYDQ